MKNLLIITLSLISLQSFALDKESAKNLYELNKQTFNEKELLLNTGLCNFQNELAEVLGEEKLPCNKRHSSKDDTTKGDMKLANNLREVNQMADIRQDMDKKEFNILIDNAINRMRNNYGL